MDFKQQKFLDKNNMKKLFTGHSKLLLLQHFQVLKKFNKHKYPEQMNAYKSLLRLKKFIKF